LEDDGSNLDDEEMAMITRKFKKFFKKARENSKKKNIRKPKSSDHDQFTGCFKCGKHDHSEKLPLAKGRTRARTVLNQGRKQLQNSFARHFSKAMMAALGDTLEEDEASEEDKAAAALMARSESESNFESVESLY